MNREDRKLLYALIEQEARAEIMARLGPVGFPEYADYFMIAVKKRDEIRELMFGTSDLVMLGERWGLLKTIEETKRKQASQLRQSKKHKKHKKHKKKQKSRD